MAAFTSAFEDALPAPISVPTESHVDQAQPVESQGEPSTITVDDLSTTAALLLSSVEARQREQTIPGSSDATESSSTREKFANSAFMALMQRLKDREVVVEGNDMVDSATRSSYTGINGSGGWADQFLTESPPSATAADVKGKGKAVDMNWVTEEDVNGYTTGQVNPIFGPTMMGPSQRVSSLVNVSSFLPCVVVAYIDFICLATRLIR
jgi:hypothetical protein